MDRRSFAQFLTLGAGSLSLGQASAQSVEDNNSTAPDQKLNQKQSRPDPVNVADIQAMAKAKLPRATFDYITTGSADQITLRENVAAYQRLRVYPPLMRGVSDADLSTTVLGQKLKLPVMLAPVAAQRMYHTQGGLAAARAAATAGTVYGVSSSVGHSVEEIASSSSGPKWFQLYVPKDRKVARTLVQRVERAGYGAIIVTVDLGEWKDADRRNRFTLPKQMLVKHLRDIGFSQITDKMSYDDIIKFNAEAWDLSLSWQSLTGCEV